MYRNFLPSVCLDGINTFILFVSYANVDISKLLTHSFPMHPFSTPENIKKLYSFLMISGGRGRCIGNEWVKGRAKTYSFVLQQPEPLLKVPDFLVFRSSVA